VCDDKYSVRTAKKTLHFTITTINRLTLFKGIIAVYSENRTELINALCGQNAELLNVKAGGSCNYCLALKALINTVVFWDVAPSILVDTYRRFRDSY
jgi:hypothetical protein